MSRPEQHEAPDRATGGTRTTTTPQGYALTTHWVDKTWSGQDVEQDWVLRSLVAKASEDIGEPVMIYPLGVTSSRRECVSTLAVAIDDDTGPVGVRAFARRRGVWVGTFSWTRAEWRRRGVSTALLEHALSDLPVTGLEGPFTMTGYRACRSLGRRFGLEPHLGAYVKGLHGVKAVRPDWSLGPEPSLRVLFADADRQEQERDAPEPWVDLPAITLSPITRSPRWLDMSDRLHATFVARGWA